jgi:hypothetical protein
MEIDEKKRLTGFNKDIVVFAFFLLLAFALWYLNSLGKDMEADIRQPVSFINLPKGKMLTQDAPSRLVLSLKGPGFSVLKLKYYSRKNPVIIDLARVTYKKMPDSKSSDYYIVTTSLLKNFSTQLRSGVDVVAVKPDTLFISFARSDGK